MFSEAETSRPFLVIFFIGFLSIYYAEVYSGSSPLWFVTIWGWIITIELYLAHLLFYLNIAIRKSKVSLLHLYLLGCLVGLYEGPITKVLWHGYPGQTANTFFLGFAVTEFLMLVFFWHPIFSFMIPILIFELLSVNYLHKTGSTSFLENSFFFTNQRRAKLFFFVIAFIGATFLSVNAGFNLGITLLSGVVNVLVLLFLSNKLLGSNNLRGVQSLALSDKWFKIVFLYLVALYSFTFFVLNPQFIPGPLTLFLTVMIFVFIFYLFSRVPHTDAPKTIKSPPIDFREYIKYSWITWLGLLLIFPFIVGYIVGVLILSYLAMLAFGTFTFLRICLKSFSPKRKNITF